MRGYALIYLTVRRLTAEACALEALEVAFFVLPFLEGKRP
jgi:hypothetical protein